MLHRYFLRCNRPGFALTPRSAPQLQAPTAVYGIPVSCLMIGKLEGLREYRRPLRPRCGRRSPLRWAQRDRSMLIARLVADKSSSPPSDAQLDAHPNPGRAFFRRNRSICSAAVKTQSMNSIPCFDAMALKWTAGAEFALPVATWELETSWKNSSKILPGDRMNVMRPSLGPTLRNL